ncbi:serine/threonine protein phosphatase [Flavobacterium sp. F-65]|uniref:Serine/threonine protein phosphatase n=1 Tax=Flavobacterium pisciphilum TaxID=2893755 RepID=A0ABS8MV03_9FLAO|nr:metallophosphoesterase family protein [Flavobacterium sp. F-65]MCC9072625.1 serine/threonine protein phosphatase [Flavobacterium sp. F-65]
MKRRLVIGDIHGGFRALTQILERIKIKSDDDLIFLGDYVDGWSESAQVIDFLVDLSKKYNCIFIKGNHDIWCEGWLESGNVDAVWVKHGGAETIKSYENYTAELKREHLLFFKKMENYYIDEQKRLFIHAGFSSMHGPEKEHYSTNYSWDRTLWEMALTMDKRIKKDSLSYPKRLLLFDEIYIGHTPTLHYGIDVPMQGCNVWNIDTGAGFYGKLSCIDIDTKTVYQSDVVKDMYPDEKGRN